MISHAARRISRFINFDEHLSEVVENAGQALVLLGAGLGLGFVVNVVLARLLGADGVGIYYLAFDITNVAITLATFGLTKTVLRFVAAHASLEEWGAVWTVYRKSILIVVGLSVGLTVVLVVLAPWIAHSLYDEPDLASALRLMALITLPTAILFIYAQALRGLKRVRESVFLSAVAIPLSSLPLIYLFARPAGIPGAITGRLVATCVLVFLSILLWRKAMQHVPQLSAAVSTSVLLKTS